MSNTNKAVENNKIVTPAIETKKIESDKIADLLNASKAIKSTSKNNEYNYRKIVENLTILNNVLNLNLSEKEVAEIKKDATNFIQEKTKRQFATNEQYAKIKRSVRNSVRLFLHSKDVASTHKETLKTLIY